MVAQKSTRRETLTGLAGSASLGERYEAVRTASEAFCEPLATEDYVVQTMPDASPTKWHLAHTSWFFETFVLRPFAPDYQSPNDAYQYLFNSYYVQAGPRFHRPSRGLISRPTVEDIYRYRSHVDGHMRRFLEASSADPAIEKTVVIGLHHEQQHQELMYTDLKHVLSMNPLRPAYLEGPPSPVEGSVEQRWIDYPGGLHWIGHDGADFCFDNEQPRHQEFLQPFKLASRPVSAGEYLEFVESGGYERPELWLSLGASTVAEEGWEAPLYWERLDGNWRTFTMFGMRDVDPAEPVVHVSYFEADAYARWRGARLPTEAEWEAAAEALPVEGNFSESGNLHPVPARPAGVSAAQIYGDVWEWTRSQYAPYPGYSPSSGAIGEYNGKFMANQFVLRGGSCATPESHIRSTYRNFFPPEARWQVSGIRLAMDA